MSCCFCGAVYVAVPVIAFILFKYFTAKKGKPDVHEKNYKKDTVYLYQFPRSKTVPNVSPFCLKLETFLRVNKINYEVRDSVMTRSQQGLLPFVELNGEHIADSQLIYERLRKHFNAKPLSSAAEEACSRAVSRMLEGHSFYVIYKYKILDEVENFVSNMASDIGVPSFLLPIVQPILVFSFKRRATQRISGSLGMFSDSEFNQLLHKDLDVLKDILGNKKFLFGEELSTADYSAFGVLATTYYLPFETHVRRVMKEEYPSLVEYCERIKNLAFKDDFTI